MNPNMKLVGHKLLMHRLQNTLSVQTFLSQKRMNMELTLYLSQCGAFVSMPDHDQGDPLFKFPFSHGNHHH